MPPTARITDSSSRRLMPFAGRSIIWKRMPRSLKKHCAFFVSKHLDFPKIWIFSVNASSVHCLPDLCIGIIPCIQLQNILHHVFCVLAALDHRAEGDLGVVRRRKADDKGVRAAGRLRRTGLDRRLDPDVVEVVLRAPIMPCLTVSNTPS